MPGVCLRILISCFSFLLPTKTATIRIYFLGSISDVMLTSVWETKAFLFHFESCFSFRPRVWNKHKKKHWKSRARVNKPGKLIALWLRPPSLLALLPTQSKKKSQKMPRLFPGRHWNLGMCTNSSPRERERTLTSLKLLILGEINGCKRWIFALLADDCSLWVIWQN